MSIQDKYATARASLKNGDIILFRSSTILGKLIQFFDKSYYNHIGVIWISDGRLFIIDSLSAGVHPDFLSNRMSEYTDFGIVRLNRTAAEIEINMGQIIDKCPGTKYNFARIFQIAIYKKLGWDIKKLDGNGRNICSQFVQRYTDLFPIKCYLSDNLITPQAFIREANKDEVVIWIDDEPK